MIAIELLFIFLLIGLGTVIFLQWQARKTHADRGHKGDAHKTAEEEELHKNMKPRG